MNNSPLKRLLKHWDDTVLNLFGLSSSASNIYHRDRKLNVWFLYHCCSGDILHCSKWWPIANKWQYCTKCSSFQRKNNLQTFNILHHSLGLCLCVSFSNANLLNPKVYRELPLICFDFSRCPTHCGVTDDLFTGGLCASPQDGLRSLYIDLHQLTLRNDPPAQTAWCQSHWV